MFKQRGRPFRVFRNDDESSHVYTMQYDIVTYGRTTGRSEDTQAVSAMHRFQQLQPTVLLPLATLKIEQE